MSDITEEMIEKAAHAFCKAANDNLGVTSFEDFWSLVLTDSVRDEYRTYAVLALGAALAGRASLELPQPTGRWSDGVPYWDAENRVVTAQVDESGRPYTRLNGQILLVTEAEAVGLALVAAAREARRLASGFSESGDPS